MINTLSVINLQFTHNSQEKCQDREDNVGKKADDEGSHDGDVVEEVAPNPIKD